MFDNKLKTPFIALMGAVALLTSAPAFAQNAAPAAPAAEAAGAAPATAAAAPAATPAPADPGLPPQMQHGGHITLATMFLDAKLIVKFVMVGLFLCSVLSWTMPEMQMFWPFVGAMMQPSALKA